jgi:hypothetical protein
MESAFGAEGEVLRAGQVGDRDEPLMRWPGTTRLVTAPPLKEETTVPSPLSPLFRCLPVPLHGDGGGVPEAEGDGEGGTGRPGRKRSRPAQDTQRRPSRGAAAAADSRAGWSRVDPAGQPGDSSPEDRSASLPPEDSSASLPRGEARPPLRGEADFATDEALETAEAVAVSRGIGEQAAADVARIPGRSASR